jgi:hypothetical protein
MLKKRATTKSCLVKKPGRRTAGWEKQQTRMYPPGLFGAMSSWYIDAVPTGPASLRHAGSRAPGDNASRQPAGLGRRTKLTIVQGMTRYFARRHAAMAACIALADRRFPSNCVDKTCTIG